MSYTLHHLRVAVSNMTLYTRMTRPATPHSAIPVVLVHAFGTSSRYMQPLEHLLAEMYPVYTLDLPGHGRSRVAPFLLDFPTLVPLLDEWMAALHLRQAVLVGHSSGCQTVLHLGLHAPDRVRGAVLLAPAIDERTRSVFLQGLRLLGVFPFESLTLPLALLQDYGDVGLRHMTRVVRFDVHSEFLALLPRFVQPTAVVSGSQDLLVPPSWGEHVTQLLPNARFVQVPHAGHAMQYSAPQRLVTALAPFWADLLASTPAAAARVPPPGSLPR